MDEKGPDAASHSAVLRPSGRRFTAAADRTVLASAAGAGIDMTSSCRNGSCRACLRPLHEGRVAYRIEWPGLLPEEKEGGWLLPCVAYPQSDLVLGD